MPLKINKKEIKLRLLFQIIGDSHNVSLMLPKNSQNTLPKHFRTERKLRQSHLIYKTNFNFSNPSGFICSLQN